MECALKACVAKRTKEHDFPPDRKRVERIYSHDLSALVDAAELGTDLKDVIDRDPLMLSDWNTIQDWSERSRYEIKAESEAIALLDAIENGKGGLLPWVRQRW